MFKYYNLSPLNVIGTLIFIAGIIIPESIFDFWTGMFFAIMFWSLGATAKQDEFGKEISEENKAKNFNVKGEDLQAYEIQYCAKCGTKFHKDGLHCPECGNQSRYQIFAQKLKLTRVIGSLILFTGIFSPDMEFITGLMFALMLWFVGDIKGINESIEKENIKIDQSFKDKYFRPSVQKVQEVDSNQYCTECGHEYTMESNFCPNCGSISKYYRNQQNKKLVTTPIIG
ncbi:MAG: zinc-ribbon domain-containing protein [Candidatus Kariarchaeaceae archaeon]|jgi:uncharacterized OB-fold protein